MMDDVRSEPREIPNAEINRNTDTRDMLALAARQRRDYNLDDYLIVDVDARHFETRSWAAVIEYIPDEVIRDIAGNFKAGGKVTPGIIQASSWPTHQSVGGRIPHDPGTDEDTDGEGVHRDVVLARRALIPWASIIRSPSRRPCCHSACIPSSMSRSRCRAVITGGFATG